MIRDAAVRRRVFPEEEMNWTQPYIGIWQQKTFPNGTLGGTIKHLEKEMKELKKAAISGDGGGIRIEAADMAILLNGVANKAGFDLQEAINEKMEINIKRKWDKIDPETGIYQHREKP